MPGRHLSSEDGAIFHIVEVRDEFEGETTYGVVLHRDKCISSALRSMLTIPEVPDPNN